MVILSKRERYFVTGIAVGLVLLLVYWLAVNPYLDKVSALADEHQAVIDAGNYDAKLLKRQEDLEPTWRDMQKHGLQTDYFVAQSQTQHALQDWTRGAGIVLEAFSSERAPSQEGQFQVINFNIDFNVAGADSMRKITQLLWSIESSLMPIRINDMKIQSTREGTDQLNVKLIVSALYMSASMGGGSAHASGGAADNAEVP